MSNLVQRILVALAGIPLLLYAVIHGSWVLVTLVVLLQAVCLFEWRKLNAAHGASPAWVGLALGTVGMNALIIFGATPVGFATGLACIALMLLSEVFRKARQPLASLGPVALFLLYVSLPLALWTQFGSTVAAQRFEPAGPLALLLVTTWFCDSGAYFSGRSLGRHKLYPAASPNKTWEGFFGGIVAAGVVLPLAHGLGFAAPSLLDCIVLPLIVGIAGQLGDLLESLMKREAQVKDTSGILPGHGGFLDRFDSLLISTPFLYAYLLVSSTQ